MNISDGSIIDDDGESVVQQYQTIPTPNLKSDLSNLDNFMNNVKSIEDEQNPQQEKKKFVKRNEVVEDFIWNYLTKNNMQKTFNVFQEEFYSIQNSIASESITLPDVYQQNLALEQELKERIDQIETLKLEQFQIQKTWSELKKQTHKYKTEALNLQTENKQMKNQLNKQKEALLVQEQKFQEIVYRYEITMKERMLLRLEKERLLTWLQIYQDQEQKQKEINQEKVDQQSVVDLLQQNLNLNSNNKTKIPKNISNPFEDLNDQQQELRELKQISQFQASKQSITKLKVNYNRPFLATISEDWKWRIWSIPSGELVVQGDGHQEWLSDINFHPEGNTIATASGDGIVKLWDLARTKCVWTIKDFTQPVWSLDFNYTGDFLIVGSMNQKIKLYDVQYQKQRYSFKSHTDSINKLLFSKYTSCFLSASSDKTISQWDIRTGLVSFTLFGHKSPINTLTCSQSEFFIYSGDQKGNLIQWDVWMMKKVEECCLNNEAINSISVNSQMCFASTNKGNLFQISQKDLKIVQTLKVDNNSLNDCDYDFLQQNLITGGQDGLAKLWKC